MVVKVDKWDESMDYQKNKNKYLDACSTWLLDATDPPAQIPTLETTEFNNITFTEYTTNVGMSDTELHVGKSFKCCSCNNVCFLGKTGKAVIANPWTHARYIMMCNACDEML